MFLYLLTSKNQTFYCAVTHIVYWWFNQDSFISNSQLPNVVYAKNEPSVFTSCCQKIHITCWILHYIEIHFISYKYQLAFKHTLCSFFKSWNEMSLHMTCSPNSLHCNLFLHWFFSFCVAGPIKFHVTSRDHSFSCKSVKWIKELSCYSWIISD